MSNGRDLSRRAVLATLGTVGTVGGLVGAGTTSLYDDHEHVSTEDDLNTGDAGQLDVEVTWSGPNGATRSSESGTATVELDLTGDPPTDSRTLSVSLPKGDNPVRLWVVPTCPSGQASYVDAAFSYPCTSDGPFVAGRLTDVIDGIRAENGLRIDPGCTPIGPDGCLQPGTTLDLETEFAFLDDAGYDGTDPNPVTFTLQFAGRQCRYHDTETPFSVTECRSSSPPRFGLSYVEIYAREGGACTRIGKLELEHRDCYAQPGIGESSIESGRTYDLYEDIGGRPDGVEECRADDTGYDLRVTDTETKDGGSETTAVEFALLDDDGSEGPQLCKVEMKGGQGTVTYDSDRYFDGNETDGLLDAPRQGGGGS